jgi:ATP-dependent DNA ligase
MTLAVKPPVAPMLARLERELPHDGYLYEPKWDGFRCMVFRDEADVDLRSRNQRPLARYFPELVRALLDLPVERFALDGEIVVPGDFEALLRRLHPAASRVERLSVDTPASLIAFDLLALQQRDLRELPFVERRRLLEELFAAVQPPLALTESTDDEECAAAWLDARNGVDGVVAKHRELRYEPGVRAMVKVKHEHTAECVVAGFRWLRDRPLPRSLLLGLYDEAGGLQHVGIVSSIAQSRRRALLEHVAPHVVELEGHPWEHGFLAGGGSTGKLPGAAGRWTPDMDQDWVPLAPELVCEVAYDQVDRHRLRHPARFRRWRPDLDPRACTLAQLAR